MEHEVSHSALTACQEMLATLSKMFDKKVENVQQSVGKTNQIFEDLKNDMQNIQKTLNLPHGKIEKSQIKGVLDPNDVEKFVQQIVAEICEQAVDAQKPAFNTISPNQFGSTAAPLLFHTILGKII